MNIPKKILVVISGKRKTHEALERALLFANAQKDIHIHIFNSIYEPVMELTDKKQYLADRYLYMDEIAQRLDKIGIKCSVQVAWHRELHESIEQAAIELNPDLVIKRISADVGSINPFAMPVDRHLLRYCPIPLLLVKDAQWIQGPIIAAVDPCAADNEHQILNGSILEYSKMLGQLTGNSVFSVSSYVVPSISPNIGIPEVDYEMIRHDTFKSYQEKMQTLLKSHDFPLENMHIIEGQAERAIPQFVEQTHSQLVVIGTVGRTGMSAAFIGNTAEHVLAELACDVLALKP